MRRLASVVVAVCIGVASGCGPNGTRGVASPSAVPSESKRATYVPEDGSVLLIGFDPSR